MCIQCKCKANMLYIVNTIYLYILSLNASQIIYQKFFLCTKTHAENFFLKYNVKKIIYNSRSTNLKHWLCTLQVDAPFKHHTPQTSKAKSYFYNSIEVLFHAAWLESNLDKEGSNYCDIMKILVTVIWLFGNDLTF